jgi:hypothetical protein
MGFAATPGATIDDVTINAMGFTGDVLRYGKPEGVKRILTLGESSLFNRRMTERIRNRLQRTSNARIEIVGAALRAHTTRASVLKYEHLRGYDFDWVLIYHGINDLWANRAPREAFREDYSHLDAWYRRNFWLDRCVLCRFVYNAVSRRPVYADESPSHDASAIPFERNLSTLVERVHLDGATPVLMTFAWSIPPNYTYEAFAAHRIGYNNPTSYDRWPVELWGSPEYVRRSLDARNRIVRRLAERRSVPLLDQERLMGKELRWFGDVCHLSDEGTDRFIENIADRFAREGWLPQGR